MVTTAVASVVPSSPAHHHQQQQQQQSILPSSSSSYSDDVDIESLRQVLSGTSPEELRRRKPHELRELLEEKGTTNIPRFLLDSKDENHIAPHMLALELLMGKNNRDGIYRRVDTTDNNTTDDDDINDYDNETANKHYYKHNHNNIRFSNNCSQQSQDVLLVVAAILSLLCQFVLEVFGGAGAIWGVAELTRLRYGGIDHKSWNIFSWIALVIGLCCLIRFIVINCVCNDISFYEKYKHEFQFNNNSNSQSQSLFFLNKLHIVTKDPILFLRARCCCCYCYCSDSLSSSLPSPSAASLPTENDNNNNNNNEQNYIVKI